MRPSSGSPIDPGLGLVAVNPPSRHPAAMQGASYAGQTMGYVTRRELTALPVTSSFYFAGPTLEPSRIRPILFMFSPCWPKVPMTRSPWPASCILLEPSA